MRDLLLQAALRRPFAPFTLLLDGGFEVTVLWPHAILIETSVLYVQVIDENDIWTLVDTDRIVGIRSRRNLSIPGR